MPPIYHEKQRLQYCLLHSLNNLFQGERFSRSKLNAVAEGLAIRDPELEPHSAFSSLFLTPHHNILTGNYDINVLIAALEGEGKSVVWHDSRDPPPSLDPDPADPSPRPRLMGVMVNVAVERFMGLWKSRHWVALRRIEGVWYNLDSDLSSPRPFPDHALVRFFFDSVLSSGGQLFLVLDRDEPDG